MNSAMARSVLAVALIVFGASALASQTVDSRDALNKGVSAFRNGQYASAVDYFKLAAQLDRNFTTAEVYLATAYAQQYLPTIDTAINRGFAENAIATFKRVLQREPNNIPAIMGLASIYQNSGDLQNARETYIKATSLDPQNPIPFYSIGSIDWLIVYDKKNPRPFGEQIQLIQEGQTQLDAALALNPDFDDAMTYKNLLFREQARLSLDPTEKDRLTAVADDWFNRALETRKRNREARTAPPAPR